MKRTFVILAVLLFLLMNIFPTTAYAAEVDYPFTVEITIPENNIDQLGYYHVPGNSGETIVLQAIVFNLTDQPIEVSAIPLNAYSGLDGITYQSPVNVDSLTYALADESYGLAQYIETVDTVYIVPKGSMNVSIRVKVPDIDAGTLLGGHTIFGFCRNTAGTESGSRRQYDTDR